MTTSEDAAPSGTEQRLSYSEITTFRRCPQQWNYSYVQGLSREDPEDAKVELEFGQWWHALRAADSITRGTALGSIKSTPKDVRTVEGGPRIPSTTPDLEQAVIDAAGSWWKSLTPAIQDVWVERLGGSLVDRLTYVNDRWLEQWEEDRQYEQPLGVEVWWSRPLPALPQAEGAVDPLTLVPGVIDEVYLDTRRNLVVVRDHKTHRTLGTRAAVDDMMDSQLQLYAWGAAPVVASWGVPPIRAVAYDRVRSTAPKSPAVTQAGTLSKSVSDYDLHTYRTWAAGPEGKGVPYPGRKKDGSDAGLYLEDEKVVQSLSDPASRSAWLQRTLTPLNRNLVTTHLRASVDTALEVARTRQRLELTGEAGRNLSPTCKWCDFQPLCQAQMLGGVEGDYDLKAMNLVKREKR